MYTIRIVKADETLMIKEVAKAKELTLEDAINSLNHALHHYEEMGEKVSATITPETYIQQFEYVGDRS